MGLFTVVWVLAALSGPVIVIVLVVLLVKYLGRPSHPASPPWPGPQPAPPVRSEPPDILPERFARGEITVDEFETAKRALGYPSGPRRRVSVRRRRVAAAGDWRVDRRQ